MTHPTGAGSHESEFFADLLVAIDRELGIEAWDEARAQALLEAAEPATRRLPPFDVTTPALCGPMPPSTSMSMFRS